MMTMFRLCFFDFDDEDDDSARWWLLFTFFFKFEDDGNVYNDENDNISG